MLSNRNKRLESIHSENDAFVKRQQAQMAKYAGKNPKLEAKDMEFNAEMMNNGMHAQELATKLTNGLDKVAYPVKSGGRDDS